MCDDDAIDETLRLHAETISRRGFGALTLGAGVASLLPLACEASLAQAPATPLDGVPHTTESDVSIVTPDGNCDAYFVHPTTGVEPAVLIWPDIFGLRPAFRQMAKRLAEEGYAVLVVNPFYRTQKAPPFVPYANRDAPTREALTALRQSLTAETAAIDAKAFAGWLDRQSAVDKGRKMGVTGYCLGGAIVMRTAAMLPDRIGAAATFHGADLVTEKPDSPHLLIPKMKARFLIAIAASDDAEEPNVKDVLKEAFVKASLPAEIEVYKGVAHGWCPPDSRVYNREAAERAWQRQLALFKEGLA